MSEAVREYAKALWELSHEEGLDAELLGQTRMLEGILAENPDFVRLLAVPSVPKSERTAVIDRVFGEALHPYLSSFIKLLIRRDRIKILPECLDGFERLWYENSGIKVARVRSAVPLGEEQKSRLLRALEKKTGSDIEMIFETDPSLIGGVSVSVDGELFEDTIRRRLDGVRKTLTEKVL